MARLIIVGILVALACCAAGIDDVSKNRNKRLIITDLLIGQRCNDDSDCQSNECCTPRHIFGKRCRSNLSEGDYCGKTYIGTHFDRIYRKCPCAMGLTCRNTRKILGLYKIYKCTI